MRLAHEEAMERERLRASNVPNWVIERKIVDNNRELEELELQEMEEEDKARNQKFPNNTWGQLGYFEDQMLKSDDECRAREKDQRWLVSGMTRREIVQLKKEDRLGGREMIEEMERREDEQREEMMRERRRREIRGDYPGISEDELRWRMADPVPRY